MKTFLSRDEVRSAGPVRFWVYTRGSFLVFLITQVVIMTCIWKVGVALAAFF